MTPSCVHQERQEFNADCIFCREIQQKEGEKEVKSSGGLRTEDLFGEVIDSYTDAQALEDGFLVELYQPARFHEFPINRMTQHLFDDLAPLVETEASLFNGDLSRALASILRTKCSFAQGDPGNTGEIGDIYRIR